MSKITDNLHTISIEPDRNNYGFSVYGFGPYPKSSVNYGMTRKVFLAGFNSIDECLQHYPNAEVSEGIRMVEPDPGPVAPDWFDPYAAGERWDEDY